MNYTLADFISQYGDSSNLDSKVAGRQLKTPKGTADLSVIFLDFNWRDQNSLLNQIIRRFGSNAIVVKTRTAKELYLSSPLTTGQVAKILNVSTRTAAKYIDNGDMSSYRLPNSNRKQDGDRKSSSPGDRRVLVSSLMEFVKKINLQLVDSYAYLMVQYEEHLANRSMPVQP